MMNQFLVLAMAQPPGGAGGAGGPGGQSPMFMPVMMLLVVGFMFFMQIRAQRRKDKERKDLLSAVKSGDRVLFSGGIIGVVTNVKEKTLVIRVSDKTKLEVLRAAVTSVIKSDELPSGTEAEMGGN